MEAAKFHPGRSRYNTINFMQELESACSGQTFPAATDAALSHSLATTENPGGKKWRRSGHTFQKQSTSQFISS